MGLGSPMEKEMKKISSLLLAGLIACGASNAFASAATAKPMRVGPVQNYGALGTASGKVISLETKKPVMLRGMSLYWSDATGSQYYNGEVMSWAAENLGIDVIRFAMGIKYYDQGSKEMDPKYSYIGSPDSYIALLDAMVEAAIKNDIYIIIDWHSHVANQEQTQAAAFFKQVAEKYKDVPNVIFEVWNEPVNQGWSTIQSYANTVSAGIRQYSQNLILVGTPNWSQMTQYGGVNATNVAYVLHFYAGTHSVGSYAGKAEAAMNSGNAVFISEWGTTNADGNGTPSESGTSSWINWMEQHQVSNCNWSLRQFTGSIDGASEQSAMFNGDKVLYNKQLLSEATYTASGTLVKNYLTKYKRSWADSLVAGKNSGGCAFKVVQTTETAGSITGKASGSCTYTSSNDAVATVSGGNIAINGAGFAVLTGNDGSQSVVVVAENPKQTLAGFVNFTCRMDGTCNGGKTIRDLTKNGQDNETVVSTTGKTVEGATVSFKSLNPSIVAIKQAKCANSSFCYGNALNSTVNMYEFSKTLGEAKVVATAPAVSGFQPVNDTITVAYAKGLPRISAKNYKSQTIPLGTTVANFFSDVTAKDNIVITYTFNGEATSQYVTKVGDALVAGNQNAIIQIVATTEETATYEAMNIPVTIIVGDSALAVNKEEIPQAILPLHAFVPFRAELQETGLLLHVTKAGLVEWGIYNAAGKQVLSNKSTYSEGTHWVNLETLPAGTYIMNVRQGSTSNSFRWNKIW